MQGHRASLGRLVSPVCRTPLSMGRPSFWPSTYLLEPSKPLLPWPSCQALCGATQKHHVLSRNYCLDGQEWIRRPCNQGVRSPGSRIPLVTVPSGHPTRGIDSLVLHSLVSQRYSQQKLQGSARQRLCPVPGPEITLWPVTGGHPRAPEGPQEQTELSFCPCSLLEMKSICFNKNISQDTRKM